jgi:hypothetical protein
VLCESFFSHVAHMKKAFRNKLTSKNLENLLFFPLNKYKPFDYQKLAFILIKNWKYKVEILPVK